MSGKSNSLRARLGGLQLAGSQMARRWAVLCGAYTDHDKTAWSTHRPNRLRLAPGPRPKVRALPLADFPSGWSFRTRTEAVREAHGYLANQKSVPRNACLSQREIYG